MQVCNNQFVIYLWTSNSFRNFSNFNKHRFFHCTCWLANMIAYSWLHIRQGLLLLFSCIYLIKAFPTKILFVCLLIGSYQLLPNVKLKHFIFGKILICSPHQVGSLLRCVFPMFQLFIFNRSSTWVTEALATKNSNEVLKWFRISLVFLLTVYTVH